MIYNKTRQPGLFLFAGFLFQLHKMIQDSLLKQLVNRYKFGIKLLLVLKKYSYTRGFFTEVFVAPAYEQYFCHTFKPSLKILFFKNQTV